MSQCPLSVMRCLSCIVRHQQFALNDIFSETTRPRALIFGMKHCLVDFYQVCLNTFSLPGVQNDTVTESLGFASKMYIKILPISVVCHALSLINNLL